MDQRTNTFLETEKISRLMRKYSVPCIISLLVAALYNIADQIFIANADYLGSYGNAANTVVFPLTIVALSIAVMIGDGCCAFVSISLGAGKTEDANRSVGNAVLLCVFCSIVLTAAYLLFMEPILTLFGGKVNEETYACAREYFFWITLGIPFYMFGQAMNPIIRSDGSPKFAMAAVQNMCTKYGAMDAVFGQPEYAQIPLAVLGIVMKFFQIAISIAVGMAAGCIPVVGYNIGAKRKYRARTLFTYLLLAEAIVGTAALIIVECFPTQLISIFGAGNESAYYTEFAVRSFRTYLCMMMLATVNKGTFIYLQALGKAVESTIISLTREVIFGVALPIILPIFFGLDGLLYSFPAADILTFLIAIVIIRQTYGDLRDDDQQEVTG